jgi:hypothetical protein
MRCLAVEQMAVVDAGVNWKKVVNAGCDILTLGAIGYGAGVLFHWWNPVGWVDGVLLVGSGACFVYQKVS